MFELEVKNLSKSYGSLQAVDDVSFGINEGQVFGLIGRNGAGKTTTIRMMMNIVAPDRGEVLYRGQPIGDHFRKVVSYLPEERGLYKKMKVRDILDFYLEIKGIKPVSMREKVDEYLDRFQLGNRSDSKIEDLSKGNQQKVQFIAAIISNPDCIVLDEPFSGLDPVNTAILKDIILELKAQGKVIIFSTHLMEFAERMCDGIALIHNGKLMLNGSLSEIKKQYSQRNISLVYEGDISFLKDDQRIEAIQDYGNSTGLKVRAPDDVQSILQSLVEHRITVKKFDANDISLQEIFLEVAGDHDPAENNSNVRTIPETDSATAD